MWNKVQTNNPCLKEKYPYFFSIISTKNLHVEHINLVSWSCSCGLFRVISRKGMHTFPVTDSSCFVWCAGQEWHSLVDPSLRGSYLKGKWKPSQGPLWISKIGLAKGNQRKRKKKKKKTCVNIPFLWVCVKGTACNLIRTPTLMIWSPP